MSRRLKIAAAGALLLVAVVTGSAIAQATGASAPEQQSKPIQRGARDLAKVPAAAGGKAARKARSAARSTRTDQVTKDHVATKRKPVVTSEQPEMQEPESDDDDPAEAADDDQGENEQADDDQGDENEQADDDDQGDQQHATVSDQDDGQPQADDDDEDDNADGDDEDEDDGGDD